MLIKDFIEPRGISRWRVAKLAGVRQPRIDEIRAGQRAVIGGCMACGSSGGNMAESQTLALRLATNLIQ